MIAGTGPDLIGSLLPRGERDRVRSIRKGLPYAALQRVKAVVDLSDEQLARVLLLSERTLARRKREGQLQPLESDRLLVLADIVRLAATSLDSIKSARAWLLEPHALLDGEAPLDRLDTSTGAEEVRALLYSIEYSMPL